MWEGTQVKSVGLSSLSQVLPESRGEAGKQVPSETKPGPGRKEPTRKQKAAEQAALPLISAEARARATGGKTGHQRGKDPWEGCREGRTRLHYLRVPTTIWQSGLRWGEAEALPGTPGLCGSITAQGPGSLDASRKTAETQSGRELLGQPPLACLGVSWHPPEWPVTQAGPSSGHLVTFQGATHFPEPALH